MYVKEFSIFQGFESQDPAEILSWKPQPCRFHGEPCIILDTVNVGFYWTCGIMPTDDTPVPLLQRCVQHVTRRSVENEEAVALRMVGMQMFEIEDLTWRWRRGDGTVVVYSGGTTRTKRTAVSKRTMAGRTTVA